MANLAHFDPEQQKRNLTGLSNASKTDAAVIELVYNNWEDLTFEAKRIEESLSHSAEIIDLPIGDARIREIKKRINQDFFRDTILASYNSKCCITGIDVPSLLIASHIKPWKDSNPRTERTNPGNGLCYMLYMIKLLIKA